MTTMTMAIQITFESFSYITDIFIPIFDKGHAGRSRTYPGTANHINLRIFAGMFLTLGGKISILLACDIYPFNQG